MITWHQLPGLLVSNPPYQGWWAVPTGALITALWAPLKLLLIVSGGWGSLWLCKNTEGWLTALRGWGSRRHICCGLFTCVARGLRCHAGAWMVHDPLSDTRHSECVMWVCDCAHHMPVAGWFNSTHTPPTIKTRFFRCFQSDMKGISWTIIH